jgi:hypothetical protein
MYYNIGIISMLGNPIFAFETTNALTGKNLFLTQLLERNVSWEGKPTA